MRLFSFAILISAVCLLAQDTATIRVDASASLGTRKPVYAFFGYDEPNYTYMKDGRKLLTELQALSPVPVYVRAHSLLVTGTEKRPQMGIDKRIYRRRKRQAEVRLDHCRSHLRYLYRTQDEAPCQIGFMPEALSVKPEPYKHNWDPDSPTSRSSSVGRIRRRTTTNGRP